MVNMESVINLDKRRIRKYLLIGLMGAIITVIGEMSQGLAETVAASDSMTELFATYETLPVWRIGLGSTVGAIGILLQYFGVYAIFLAFKDRDDKSSKIYKWGVYNYAFVGAIIHILMSLMIYIYKINSELVMDFTIWFVAPFLIFFFVGYIWFSIIMFNKFRRKETIFPAWCCVLNPILGKGFFNVVAMLIPVSVIANGVSYSNMGITAVVMFAVLYFAKCDEYDSHYNMECEMEENTK